jgi:hypothetical protein
MRIPKFQILALPLHEGHANPLLPLLVERVVMGAIVCWAVTSLGSAWPSCDLGEPSFPSKFVWIFLEMRTIRYNGHITFNFIFFSRKQNRYDIVENKYGNDVLVISKMLVIDRKYTNNDRNP